MFNLSKMFFGKTFSLSLDGYENGGGGGSDDNGSDSSSVNKDVTPETHFKDENNVPYFNRFQEAQRKLDGFKGVDLELYNRLKDLDPDEVEEAIKFRNLTHSDEVKLKKILGIVKGEQDAGKNGKEDPNQPPAWYVAEKNRERQEAARQSQNQWMDKYDADVASALETSLKSEDLKALGGKLSDFEKNAVLKLVDDAFAADAALARQGKRTKLTLESIPEIMSGVLKSVLQSRQGTLGGMVRKDDSPEPMKGNGNSGQPKPKAMTEKERIDAMDKYMKEQKASQMASA